MTTHEVDDGGLSHAREPLCHLRSSGTNALIRIVVALAASAAAFIPSTLTAQSLPVESRPAGADSSFVCVLKSEDSDAFNYVRRQNGPAAAGKTSANIVITFVNQIASDAWPDNAKDALNYAAAIWAGIVNSQITIRIEATWTNLGDCDGSSVPLASAGPQFIWRNFRNVPKQNTWYPDAVADALTGTDLGTGKIDIVSKFNRSCGPSGSSRWYLGIDGRPPSGTIDLASVALHEFAHGLGMFGSAEVDDGQSADGNECNGTNGFGCIGTGSSGDPMAYDRFTEDGNGLPLLALSNPSEVLGEALEGQRAGGVFFSGPQLTTAGFARARLYAPSTFNAGASYAHLDENTYNRTPEALMTPFLARAEAIHVPGALVCGILADVGWTISGDCSQTITMAEAGEEIPKHVTVAGPYPNPFSHDATLVVSVPYDQDIKIELFDTLGRPFRRLYSGRLSAGSLYNVELDASELPPGVYIVLVNGLSTTVTRTMVVTG
ncbi:MAG TPA: T9SS type A sorting domain-containing protein [Rhodothermales bacterium]|nr:T9SS type A sorting domain-containing protein [Rhodothermales bacterium]